MADLVRLHEDRAKLYGDDYYDLGKLLAFLFPNGLVLKGPEDFTRAVLFFRLLGKLTRYTKLWNAGGHADSLDDASVYAQILRHVDDHFNGGNDLRHGDDGAH